MNIKKFFLALCAHGKSIDIVTKGNRTYQVSGHPQMPGMYERIFHSDSHPTRRNIGNDEAQSALDHVTEIRLWTGHEEYRVVTSEELAAELAPFPVV